jgi:Na+-driven multidrug efflux pump
LLGKGLPKEARRASIVLFSCMAAMAIFIAILFVALQTQIGKIFSNEAAVIRLASKVSSILSLSYVLLALAFSCFGTLQVRQ